MPFLLAKYGMLYMDQVTSEGQGESSMYKLILLLSFAKNVEYSFNFWTNLHCCELSRKPANIECPNIN